MDIKSIIGKEIVVHCSTIPQAKSFLDECGKFGIEWANGDNLNDPQHIQYYGDQTCYRIEKNKKLVFADVEHYTFQHCQILEYNVLDDFRISITQNKKGNKITAIMKTPEGKYIKHATAKCRSEDKFNYKFGKNLALSRLFGLNEDSFKSTNQIDNNKSNDKLYLLDTESGEVCGTSGNFTILRDANNKQLHIGDVVKVISSCYKTRLSLVCHSNKGYSFLSGLDHHSLYDNGTGFEGKTHYFIVKEKSYQDIKVGEKYGNVKVVDHID